MFADLNGTHRLIAQVLYGTGLRLLEGLRLRVKNLDFDRGQIMMRDRKGDKDQVTLLLKNEKKRSTSNFSTFNVQVVKRRDGTQV